MPIYLSEANIPVVIRKITGNDKVKSHLENLGFIPGEAITLISKVDENVILKIKGVTLGISHELAKRILV